MKYYIAINGQPKGPFDHHQLLINGLTATSLVWTEGMDNWAQAQSIPELQELLFGRPDLDSSNPDEVTTSTPPPCSPSNQPGSNNPRLQNPNPNQYGGNSSQPFNGTCSQQPLGQIPLCPKTWLVESILVTIFCCLPFGIVGIVKASNVESMWRRGDMVGAEAASQSAGFWTKLGFWIGLALNILGPLFYVILFVGVAALGI